jgi:indolepyruvate ferredoxin oxidoreductase beta subunit
MANVSEVLATAEIAARRFIHFDMNRMAVENGTVISASLLGALAGSDCLPFGRDQFEAAVRKSGRGVEASLSAFAQAFERTRGTGREAPDDKTQPPAIAPVTGSPRLLGQWRELERRVAAMPPAVHEMTLAGLRSVVDFQDLAYGAEYLDQLERVLAADGEQHGFELTGQTAKYLARAMAYDDIFRVADLKTRGARFVRVRNEMNPPSGARMTITEFMHPRAEELVSMLPAAMGRRISSSPRLMRIVDRIFNRGRRLRTDRLLPFLQLHAISGFSRWRRGTLRHSVEAAHWAAWLDGALDHVGTDYAFAVELIRNRRLIKGYSDTHARGLSKFDKVNRGAMLVLGRADAAAWVRRLREAALLDEEGKALDGALKTVDSFAPESKSA